MTVGREIHMRVLVAYATAHGSTPEHLPLHRRLLLHLIGWRYGDHRAPEEIDGWAAGIARHLADLADTPT